MDRLLEYLTQYRDITLELVTAVENENYDVIVCLLDKRGNIIELIKTLEHTQGQFADICSKLSIAELEANLNIIMNDRRNVLKNKINQLKISKTASNSYNKRAITDSVFFNKKG